MAVASFSRAKHERAVEWIRHQTEKDPTLRAVAEGFYGRDWFDFVGFVSWLLERHLIHMPLPLKGEARRPQADVQAAEWLDFHRREDPKLRALVDRAREGDAVELLMDLIAWQISHDFLQEQ